MVSGDYHVELVNEQLVWLAPPGATFKNATSEPDVSLPLTLLLKLIGPLAPDEML